MADQVAVLMQHNLSRHSSSNFNHSKNSLHSPLIFLAIFSVCFSCPTFCHNNLFLYKNALGSILAPPASSGTPEKNTFPYVIVEVENPSRGYAKVAKSLSKESKQDSFAKKTFTEISSWLQKESSHLSVVYSFQRGAWKMAGLHLVSPTVYIHEFLPNVISKEGAVSSALALVPSQQSKGIGTELLRNTFTKLRYQNIRYYVAFIDAKNTRSLRLLMSLSKKMGVIIYPWSKIQGGKKTICLFVADLFPERDFPLLPATPLDEEDSLHLPLLTHNITSL